jgi:LemA protein
MFPGAVWIILVVAMVVPGFFLLMWVVGGYNRLVSLRNRYNAAYAQLEVELRRRYELILELVETAKAYVKGEQGTIEAVVAARGAAASANARAARLPGDTAAIKELCGAETALAATVRRLLAVAEASAELKASTAMKNLLKDLADTENQLTSGRQAYNDAVMSYNSARQTFPNNVIAGPFSFNPAESFGVDTSIYLNNHH